MAYVVLGLLMLWPQSLYELTKNFGVGVSLFYSASAGSIKRALDQLLADGKIVVTSAQGPRGKKIYEISDVGREDFRRWMVEGPMGTGNEAILARTYFLGLLDEADRQIVAARVRERMHQHQQRLESLDAQLENAEIPPGLEDVAQYQLATLQYGIVAGRTALAWAEKHLP